MPRTRPSRVSPPTNLNNPLQPGGASAPAAGATPRAPLLPPQQLPGALPSKPSIREGDPPVHDHMSYAPREAIRFKRSRDFPKLRRIKHSDISSVPHLQPAAIL